MRIDEQRNVSTLVLTMRGRLDRGSAPAVHRRILISLAEHQRALVCDMGQVRVADPMALTLFHWVGRQAWYWPGVPVVLCRADPETSDHLHRLGIDRILPVRSSLATAMSGVRLRLPIAGDALRLPTRPESASAARELVRQTCRDYPADTVDAAVLLVNEMVTNALRHDRPGELTIHVSLQGHRIRLGVSHNDLRLPRRLPRSTDGAWAWEFRLLNTFADRWGALPTAAGTLVWCLVQA